MIGGYADIFKWATILGLVSSTGPIPPILVPPGGLWLPTLTPVQGITSAQVVLDTDGINPLAKFLGNSKDPGGILECTLKLDITVDANDVQRQLEISIPPETIVTFETLGQAEICGLPSIVIAPGAQGNTASGWNGNLTAIVGEDSVLFAFETAQVSTRYFVDLSFKIYVPPYG